MKLHIANGRLIDPANRVDAYLDVFVDQGRVVAQGLAPVGFSAERVIDATGKMILPGLIDLAVRLPDASLPDSEAFALELRAALAGGITGLVALPDQTQVLDVPERVEALLRSTQALGLSNVYALGAMTVGLKGECVTEMHALRAAGCLAFSQADLPVYDTAVIEGAMRYAKTFDHALWLRAQDPWLSRGGVIASGAYASRLGLTGIPAEAETITLQTLLTLQRATGVSLHVCRLSSADGIALMRSAKKEGLPVTCDVAAHHLHLTDVDIGFYDSRYRLEPPLRGQRDRSAIREGLADGTIDAVCSDHTLVDQRGKMMPFAQAQTGATGLELLLSLALKWAQETRIPLGQALSCVTSGPARVLGLANRTGPSIGELGVGAKADFCVVDAEDYWMVSADELVSQSRQSPFLGMELPGRVHVTVVDGRVVWERPE